MSLPKPSVSFSFVEPNSNGTYTLNVEFKNVTGKYRFFVTDPRHPSTTYELFNDNKFPTGGHVTVGSGPYTFDLFYAGQLESDFNTLKRQCVDYKNKNGCEFVTENVYVDPTNNSILTGRAVFDKLLELMNAGGS